MAKIDEQISYNWLFFLLASAFGLVTFWAVYDEAVTRREYKGHQEAFFEIETNLARKNWEDSKKKLESDPKYQGMLKERDQLEAELRAKAVEISDLEQQAKELEYVAKDKTQDYTFTKSLLDEEYYYFTLAKHEIRSDTPKDSAAYQEYEKHLKKYEQLQKDLAEADKVAEEANQKWSGVKQKLDAFKTHRAQLNKQIEDMERPTAELERKYQAVAARRGGLFGADTEIIQENLEEIGRVDRCESCHVGANRGGFETVSPTYFRSHPYRRTLFALHPVEKFGCTTCHDGQGRATTKFYAHAPTEDHHDFEKHFWEYPLLSGPYMESQCRQCHREEVDLRANLRCESDAECPMVEGKQLKCAPLVRAINPAAHITATIASVPDEGRFCGQPSEAEPDKVESVLVDLAPELTRGRKMIEEIGCFGCHPLEGYENKLKPGPDLRHVASKINQGWMVSWIQNPKSIRPKTRMPNFFPEMLHPEEYPATAKPMYREHREVMAQVTANDREQRNRQIDQNVKYWELKPELQAAYMASFLLNNSTPFELPQQVPAGDVARGKKLVESLGCYGCHSMTLPGEKPLLEHKNRASHFDHGPDLGNVGAKTSREWLFAWVKNPKAYAPKTRMPNLRLTDQEAADVATYLAGNKYVAGQQKEYPATVSAIDLQDADKVYLGKKLVNYYGCYGCHYVGGFETTPGIGVDLSDFGLKEVSRLDYGDYIVKHTQQTWEKWLQNKIQHPRVYRYERVETKMPQFDLCGPKETEKREECKGHYDEITAVMVVLKGMRGRTRDSDVLGHKLTGLEKAREQGRELVRQYNCYGCHNVDGFTGDIRQMAQFQGDDENGAPRSRLAPPLLNGEGAKTQPTWLFGFLKAPVSLRQSLAVRMPTFGFSDGEATTIAHMFSALDGAEFPYHDYSDITLSPERRAMAESGFKAAQCLNCHALSDTLTPDQARIGAPNLLLAKHRLRGEWLLRWLHDPQVLAPGVNMPSFFAGGNPLASAAAPGSQWATLPGMAEVAKLDGDGVVTLLRDFLMNLPDATPGARASR